MKPEYKYEAHVLSIYDGDSMTVNVRLGMFQVAEKQKLRLYGINTPEVRGPTAEEGKKVRDYVRDLIPVGSEIVIETFPDKRGDDRKGKYGRWLAIIWVGEMNLNEKLVELGYAVEYLKD